MTETNKTNADKCCEVDALVSKRDEYLAAGNITDAKAVDDSIFGDDGLWPYLPAFRRAPNWQNLRASKDARYCAAFPYCSKPCKDCAPRY